MNTTDKYVEALVESRNAKHQDKIVNEKRMANLIDLDDENMRPKTYERQIRAIRKMFEEMTKDNALMHLEIKELRKAILEATEVQETYGKIEDDKARSLVSTYAAILSINIKTGASGGEVVSNATALMCAFLARKE